VGARPEAARAPASPRRERTMARSHSPVVAATRIPKGQGRSQVWRAPAPTAWQPARSPGAFSVSGPHASRCRYPPERNSPNSCGSRAWPLASISAQAGAASNGCPPRRRGARTSSESPGDPHHCPSLRISCRRCEGDPGSRCNSSRNCGVLAIAGCAAVTAAWLVEWQGLWPPHAGSWPHVVGDRRLGENEGRQEEERQRSRGEGRGDSRCERRADPPSVCHRQRAR
jgi:hypothetical protein